MFCLSCKYVKESPIIDCIDSIIKFHPNEKILLADSDSKDKTYLLHFLQSRYRNVEIFIENKERSIGSLWESYKRYPNEPYYVLIQDTVLIKKSLEDYFKKNNLILTFIYFCEIIGNGCLSNQENKDDYWYYKKILEKTDYSAPKLNQTIYGSFGPLLIVKNEMMKKFESKKLIENLKNSNKIEQQFVERIIGICAEQENCSLIDNNIEGEYYSRYEEILNKKIETFDKTFLMSNNIRN